ncbi:MAG TPA: GAF domain-containing sensor histidine kinase [Xanthobacteraceae bacterium]|jgi:signal transduction histidine kinase|nr:GAF domain-containing sensor histidine kinase [Xanthobacteraceae bacterium]
MMTDLSADVTAVQQLNAVPKILDAVTRITGMGFVAVARVTSDRWLCCAVRDSIDFGLVEGSELRVETTICNEIRELGELVVIDDVETDAGFCNHPTPHIYGFRSYISAPIKRANGEIWGTLCAIDPRPREIDRPEIVDSVRLFGELIAAQLDLNERFKRSQADLAARSESLLASEVGRQSAEADLKSTRADLLDERKTSELREQFIGVLGHDLRNPLASIAGGMRVLLNNANSERAPDIVASIQKSVMRMAGLVDNIMDFARGRLGGGLTIRPDANQPLTPVIEHVINEMRLAWPSLNIETDIALNEPVRCDRIKISQLFSNLLGNAITYGDIDKPIIVSAKTGDGRFTLRVTNYGTPISDKAMQSLFLPYTRGDRPSQQGLGLGLYIASEIARAHDGTLKAVSSGKETIFEFSMPATTQAALASRQSK